MGMKRLALFFCVAVWLSVGLSACQNTPVDVRNARGSGVSSLVPLPYEELLDRAPRALPTIGLNVLSVDRRSGTILCQRTRQVTEKVNEVGYIGIFLTPQDSTTTGVEVVKRGIIPFHLLGEHANEALGHTLESQIIVTLERFEE